MRTKLARKLLIVPVLALSLVFMIALAPIWVPVSIGIWVRDRLWLRRFRIRHKNRWFLICSTRHGWREFVCNNIIPAMPQSVFVYWIKRRRQDPASTEMVRAVRLSGVQLRCPSLIQITRSRMDILPMHERLLGLKPKAKKEPSVQAEVRRIVAEVMASLGRR